MTDFKKGDKLIVVDIDDEGEVCDGRIKLGDICTMMDRTSENRPFIIVERPNGKLFQFRKTRFNLA